MTAAAAAACWILLAALAPGAIPPEAAAAGTDVRATLSPSARAALDTLMRAEAFESAHIGEAGTLSENAAAVRTLIREREAPAAFQALYDTGRPVAALYALTAFWYLRPDEYPALVRQVRESHGAVRIKTQRGCIRGEETVAEVLESRNRKAIRFPPGTGVYTLVCAMRKRGSFMSDFASGVLPIEIVEGTSIRAKSCAHPPPLPDNLRPRH